MRRTVAGFAGDRCTSCRGPGRRSPAGSRGWRGSSACAPRRAPPPRRRRCSGRSRGGCRATRAVRASSRATWFAPCCRCRWPGSSSRTRSSCRSRPTTCPRRRRGSCCAAGVSSRARRRACTWTARGRRCRRRPAWACASRVASTLGSLASGASCRSVSRRSTGGSREAAPWTTRPCTWARSSAPAWRPPTFRAPAAPRLRCGGPTRSSSWKTCCRQCCLGCRTSPSRAVSSSWNPPPTPCQQPYGAPSCSNRSSTSPSGARSYRRWGTQL
mmetsp:Transcript_42858/g.136192  ORF Transcript_42858/g.136192 Transcript_42858/m.136192 type:complete len:271 (-) Transcript_42858:844-1656(-)